MNCKKCQAELEENVTLCPECGFDNTQEPTEEIVPEAEVELTEAVEAEAAEEVLKDTAEDAEAPAEEEKPKENKLTPGKITLLVVLAIAAIAVVIALILGGTSGDADATDPTGEAVATIPADGNPDDVTCKGSYTVSDEEIVAAHDDVVATMGDAKLTNGELQIYYWMGFYDFLEAYGSYASMFGLDYTQPLDTQLSTDGTMTWQQYLLDSAIASWQNYAGMSLMAQQEGFELDQEYRDYLDSLPESLEQTALSAGFASAEEMIQADMGPGATMEDYTKYLESYYLGYMYYSTKMDAIELTDAEVEAYFEEHSEEYAANGLEKNEDKYVDVRHILIMPKGGTTDSNGTTTYSEEEWEECRSEAQGLLDQWLAGDMTEDSFAQMAATYSEDTGSVSNGGLYSDVTVGQMVEPFENWCFDASRQVGDYGLVQTPYGYHVMYFVNSDLIWYETAWNDLMVEKGNEILTGAQEKFPVSIDFSAIKLGLVDMNSVSG